jgi:hypothetical protein
MNDEPPAPEMIDRYTEELGRGMTSASAAAQEWCARFFRTYGALRAEMRPAKALDRAAQRCGLVGRPTRRTAQTIASETQKKAAVRRAERAIPAEIAGPWRRCEAVAEELSFFAKYRWPTWKDLQEPPAGTSELWRALFEVFASGAVVPYDCQAIYRICYRERLPVAIAGAAKAR